jgi:hypothetical protein
MILGASCSVVIEGFMMMLLANKRLLYGILHTSAKAV